MQRKRLRRGGRKRGQLSSIPALHGSRMVVYEPWVERQAAGPSPGSGWDAHGQVDGCFWTSAWVDVNANVSMDSPLDLVPSCVGHAGLWVVSQRPAGLPAVDEAHSRDKSSGPCG